MLLLQTQSPHFLVAVRRESVEDMPSPGILGLLGCSYLLLINFWPSLILLITSTEHLLWTRNCPGWPQTLGSIGGLSTALCTSKQWWHIRKVEILSTSCPILHLFSTRGASGGWNESHSKPRPALHLFPPLFLPVAVESRSPSYLVGAYLFIYLFSGTLSWKNLLNLLLKCFYFTFIKFSHRTLDEFPVRLQVIPFTHLVLSTRCWCWGLYKIHKWINLSHYPLVVCNLSYFCRTVPAWFLPVSFYKFG